MIRHAAAAFAAFLLLMTVGVRDAGACSCMRAGPPCQNFFVVDAVFIGTVAGIAAGSGETFLPRRVEFSDVSFVRGERPPLVTVTTAGSEVSCGYPFKLGERYVVYAHRGPGGIGLQAGICSRTRRLDAAADDLEFFGSLSSPGVSRVSGSVTHTEDDLAEGRRREFGGVADVQVTVSGLERSAVTRTDARGRYDVTGLPPGKYRIEVAAPPGFAASYLERSDAFITTPRACFEADFVLRNDGRVSGTVLTADGAPAAGVRVDVVAAVRAFFPASAEALRADADANGRFAFRAVPPGRYVIVIDRRHPLDAAVAYPTTFYPGSPTASYASEIEVTGAEPHELEPMRLPPPLRLREVSGSVQLADGQPVAEVLVTIREAPPMIYAAWTRIRTDANGRFSVRLFEGVSYEALASAPGEQRTGGSGVFTVTAESAPILIRLVSR